MNSKLVRKVTSSGLGVTSFLMCFSTANIFSAKANEPGKTTSVNSVTGIDKQVSDKSRTTATVLSFLCPLAGNVYAKGAKGILEPILMGGATFLGCLVTYLDWYGSLSSGACEIVRYVLNAAPFVLPRLYYGLKAMTGSMEDASGKQIRK